ncbi:Exocyst complex component [Seminavis robusta]|uniref:Exocyst complex component n=1 Tax=Seminavis robusta TaxID=568900 RepID=A0A9N8EEJ3_9STRA|nr:Exocyst complex component [Seminavis robusta]|eukprot:Sro883_g215540.1 Exocyst complex component (475) ;mRNA; r:40582-42006
MTMMMKVKYLLLTLSSCYMVQAAFDSASFVANDVASGTAASDLVSVDFYTSPEARFDYDAIHALRPLVFRLHSTAIEFEPRMVATRGHDRGCAQEDGSPLEGELPGECALHCLVRGRYCDASLLELQMITQQMRASGNHFLEEGVTRRCIWKEYGVNDPQKYFGYFDGIAAEGCQQTLSNSCREYGYVQEGLDIETIQKCADSDGVHSVGAKPILEEAIAQPVPTQLPALFVQGKQVTGGNLDPTEVLTAVCDAFATEERPKVCQFCLETCPSLSNGESNIQECLWELKCANPEHTFQTYLGYMASSTPELPEQPTDNDDNSTTTTTSSTSNTHAIGPFPSDTEKEVSAGHKAAKVAEEGLGIVAIFILLLLGAAVIMVITAAVRVNRSKQVIDRYLQEKAELDAHNHGGGGTAGTANGGGVYGHHDPAMFPDADADMDLDAALSYGDVIGQSQRAAASHTSAPAQSKFLPEIA